MGGVSHCLNVEDARRSIDYKVLIVIACAFGLAHLRDFNTAKPLIFRYQ
ncbi:MAG: hypothetical protein L3J75_04965 [Methylococcaceae bacterium]|nr:hypothetical protein [Methylococcaceae bacterium]